MNEAYKSHESVLAAYAWVQMNGTNPEIENSLCLDDILIQASDEIQALKDRVKELEDFMDKIYKQKIALFTNGYLDDSDYEKLVQLKEGNDE